MPLVVAAGQFCRAAGETAPQAVVAALPVAVDAARRDEMAARLPAVEQIAVSAGGDVVVRLEGGAELRLGEPDDLKQKLTVAAGIIQQYLRDGKTPGIRGRERRGPGGCQGEMKVILCPFEGMSDDGAYCRVVIEGFATKAQVGVL